MFFFSSHSCHSVLHCPYLSIVCPFFFSSCIMKHLLLNFVILQNWLNAFRKHQGEKKTTHRHRGYWACRCGRKQAWKMMLHSVETRRLRLMAETRPALVLKGCGAMTATLSHLVQSGDSELEQWRLQLRISPIWVVNGSQKAKMYFTSHFTDFTRTSPVVGLVELDHLSESGEEDLSLQASIHKTSFVWWSVRLI